MAAHEVTLGFQWLMSVLSGDGTLTGLAPGGVWRAIAPPDTQTPYIIMAYQSGMDVIAQNAFRCMVDALYQVKAVGPASQGDAIAQAAERIDQLIGGPTSGGVLGGAILSCNRQMPLEMDELVDGELWNNTGGVHRLLIEQTY